MAHTPQKDIYRPLDYHHISIIEDMCCRHQFPVTVKWDFRHTRIPFPGHSRFHAKIASKIDQCRFRRISYFLSICISGIITEHAAIKKHLLVSVIKINISHGDSLSIHIIVFHCHFILRQSSCLIRADDGYAPQALNRLKFSYNCMLLGHFLCAK